MRKIFFLALITICLHPQCFAWDGRVVGVVDGDTVTVINNGRPEKIRLYGVDCPEKKQAFGQRAKQLTSKMIFKQVVEVKPVDKDRYGRTIAWVDFNGTSLNEELLRAGLAWHYKKYSSDEKLSVLEKSARQNKVGLWSDPNPVPPWDFRHGRKSNIIEKSSQRFTTSVKSDTQDIVYRGNYSSKKFHRPGCRYYNCSKCTIIFNSTEEAIQAGYAPCKICKPFR